MNSLYKVKITHPLIHYISEHFKYVIIEDDSEMDLSKSCIVVDVQHMNFYRLGNGLAKDLEKIETVDELKATIRDFKIDNYLED